ncbi:probable serine/threonine-protein kinase roco9 [Oppia nitens]|uniref:probable serine/threonine-protein kinase roco9 n=1 Tax=Oppia nitens TaxID=1686743 RepID=UPI0023DBC9D7|nr:probable serine/threonine-protein kinase roco9 [Oppia nitens]
MSSDTTTTTTSETMTSFQEIGRPIVGVGIVSTEGEKLLNALRKIQTKLLRQKQQQTVDKNNAKKTSTMTTTTKKLVKLAANETTSVTAAMDTQRHTCPPSTGDGDRRTPANSVVINGVDDGGDGDHRHSGDCHHHYHHNDHKAQRHHHQQQQQYDDNYNQSLDNRLKLIESQLQTISIQLTANRHTAAVVNGGHTLIADQQQQQQSDGRRLSSSSSPSPERKRTQGLSSRGVASVDHNVVTADKRYRLVNDDHYESSIAAIKQLLLKSSNERSTPTTTTPPNGSIPKSRSLDTLSHRSSPIAGVRPNKHFHLQYRDIPFLLGTTSNSYSVIANRQLEISRLKQHSNLCRHNIPVRKIFDDKLWTVTLDTEIKELLYGLIEEHDYICDEIQHLSRQLEQLGEDSQRRLDFNRELFFLSRRISAKQRQITELQELHSLLLSSSSSTTTKTVDNKPQTQSTNQRIRQQTIDTNCHKNNSNNYNNNNNIKAKNSTKHKTNNNNNKFDINSDFTPKWR